MCNFWRNTFCAVAAEKSLRGYEIAVQPLSGGFDYSGSIPSCKCMDGSTPATEEELAVSWGAKLILRRFVPGMRASAHFDFAECILCRF